MTLHASFTVKRKAKPEQRVLIISDAAPHRNGVGAYYADLMQDIQQQVAAIKMISPEVKGGDWQGGWSIPLPGDKTQKICLPNAFELQRRIKHFQPTVIVIPTPGMFGLLAMLLARRLSIPVIIGFHTWFEKLAHLYWNKFQGGLTKTYFELANKSLFKGAQCVLANSQEMVEIAKANGAQNAQLMGTPISQSLVREPVSAVKAVNNVLFVGRLAAEKNVTALLDAARACAQLQFNIAGDGPMRAELEQQAQGLTNVQFLGWVGREQITGLIDAHDALVLPSKVESFGTVAMEAMARQKIVLVSEACGISEWPQLRQGLRVITSTETLINQLHSLHGLSEFEIYRQSARAREVVLAHVQWNRQLWLSCFEQATNASADIEPSLGSVLRSVWSR